MRLKLVPRNTSWNFFLRSKLWIGISIILVVLSLISFFVQSLNFGIDFRGGTSIRTESSEPVNVAAYRNALSSLDLGDITISEVFDPSFEDNQNVAMIRIQAQPGQEAATSILVENSLQKLKEVNEDIKFVSVESVGPKVSGELIKTAIIAVVLAISAVLFYIWIRFEWQFAVGAISALIHDVILTIGVFSLLQIKFDLAIIAAILTIVGYSLNDTIVVSDRIRENFRLLRKSDPFELINISITQTFSRTIITSLTTLLVLLALFLLGGEMIKGFSTALIVGVLIGTYSSIYVAANVLLLMHITKEDLMPPVKEGEEVDALP